jgi:hypothetical protein
MNFQERDQKIAEITKWITSESTDEGKIKILEDQKKRYEFTISKIHDKIYEYLHCISSERNNLEYFRKELNEKIEGITLLNQRIIEKRKSKEKQTNMKRVFPNTNPLNDEFKTVLINRIIELQTKGKHKREIISILRDELDGKVGKTFIYKYVTEQFKLKKPIVEEQKDDN